MADFSDLRVQVPDPRAGINRQLRRLFPRLTADVINQLGAAIRRGDWLPTEGPLDLRGLASEVRAKEFERWLHQGTMPRLWPINRLVVHLGPAVTYVHFMVTDTGNPALIVEIR